MRVIWGEKIGERETYGESERREIVVGVGGREEVSESG
jgi:hypothetical protein